MTGVSFGDGWSTTSWGWTDDDCVTHYGEPHAMELATHRVWIVSFEGVHKGFVVLPEDTDTTEASLIAHSGFAWRDNA